MKNKRIQQPFNYFKQSIIDKSDNTHVDSKGRVYKMRLHGSKIRTYAGADGQPIHTRGGITMVRVS